MTTVSACNADERTPDVESFANRIAPSCARGAH